MFYRDKNRPPQPLVVLPAWQDKALPVIPFSPEWTPPDAEPESAGVNPQCEPPQTQATQDDSLPVIFTGADAVSHATLAALGHQWGYRVFATDDGHEALDALSQMRGAAIVVVNRKMGDIDGLEFCRAARGMEKSLYIVFVTERSGAEQLAGALAAGADDYLISPFDADELRARLRVGARVLQLLTDVAELEVASAKAQGFTEAAVVDEVARPPGGAEPQ
jgi:CheY-like chemotaxis protein